MNVDHDSKWMRALLFTIVFAVAATCGGMWLLQTVQAVTAANVVIRDLNKSDSYAQASIQRLANLHVISGDDSGDFHPHGAVTRGQMAVMIVEALQVPLGDAAKRQTFSDVPKTHWAHDYVEAAYQYGIVSGTRPGLFDVNGPLSREQMTAMLTRALGLSKQDLQGLSHAQVKQQLPLGKFQDKDKIDTWALDPAAFAVYQKIIYGTSDVTFSPLEGAEREQVAVVTDRFLSNKTQLQATADAFHVAAGAKITLDGNGVYVSLSEPAHYLDISFLDPRMKSINSRPLDYVEAPIGFEYPHVSLDRQKWDFARNLQPGQQVTINYNLALYDGDTATYTQQLTVPTDGPAATGATLLDDRDLKVTFSCPVHQETVSNGAFQVQMDDQSVDVANVTTDGQSATLQLASPVQVGQQIAVRVLGRSLVVANASIADPEADAASIISSAPPVLDPTSNRIDPYTDRICPFVCGSYFENRLPGFTQTLLVQDLTTNPPLTSLVVQPPADSKPYYIENAVEPESSTDPELFINTVWGHQITTGWNHPFVMPALAGDRVIAADDYGFGEIHAYDVLTGQPVWQYDTGSSNNTVRVYGTPQVALFTADATQQNLTALRSDTGQKLWNTTLDSALQTVVAAGDRVFVLTTGKLDAFDAHTGTLLWSTDVSGTALAANDAQLVVGTTSGQVLAYSFDGTLQFAAQSVAKKVNGIAALQGNWLLTQDNVLTALTSDGQQLWRRTFVDTIAGGNIAVDQNNVYALFRQRIETPAVGEDNVYFVDQKGIVDRLDGSTGATVASGDLSYPASTAPVAAGGKLYATTDRGKLMIFDDSSLALQNLVTAFNYGGGDPKTLHWIGVTPLLYGDEIIGLAQRFEQQSVEVMVMKQ